MTDDALLADLNLQMEEAGWRPSGKSDDGGSPRPMVYHSGAYFVVSALDPHSRSHGAAKKDGQALIDFLISIGVEIRARKPEASPAETPPDQVRTAEPDVPASVARIDPKDQELAALKAKISELESRPPEIKIVEKIVEVPAPKIPEGGEGGGEGETSVDELIDLRKSDPSAYQAKLRELSAERRRIMTDTFRAELNSLNNRRLDGQKLGEFDAQRLEDLQTLYHNLAVMGDGG